MRVETSKLIRNDYKCNGSVEKAHNNWLFHQSKTTRMKRAKKRNPQQKLINLLSGFFHSVYTQTARRHVANENLCNVIWIKLNGTTNAFSYCTSDNFNEHKLFTCSAFSLTLIFRNVHFISILLTQCFTIHKQTPINAAMLANFIWLFYSRDSAIIYSI